MVRVGVVTVADCELTASPLVGPVGSKLFVVVQPAKKIKLANNEMDRTKFPKSGRMQQRIRHTRSLTSALARQ